MGIIRNSLVSGEVPAPSQMALTDIAINNADGALYIVKRTGATSAMVQVGGITSFNERRGDIVLNAADVTSALGYTPIGTNSPAFTGTPTAPTATAGANTTQIATTAFVTNAINNIHIQSGATTLTGLSDVLASEGAGIDGYVLSYSNSQTKWIAAQLATVAKTGSYSDLTNKPSLSAVATSGSYADLTNTPAAYVLPIGSTSTLGGVKAGNGVNIATDGTLTVPTITALSGLTDVNITETAADDKKVLAFDKNSSKWVGLFLSNAAYSGDYNDLINKPAATGVVSFNTRSGNVTLTSSDVTTALGYTPVNPSSVTLTGTPTAPTAPAGTNTTQIATTAFVESEISSAISTAISGTVTSFNTRTGAITLTSSDVSTALGFTPVSSSSTALTGTPTAPTAAAGTNTTQIATTAFVESEISTAVNNAIAGTVTSFNSRNGSVTLTSADITSASGALLASPAFTGTPTAPTASAGTNTTQLATTAFVKNAISAGSVISFNTRTGAVTLTSSDVNTALGYTPVDPANASLTGTPVAPTATAGTNTTQIATTAFVTAAITASSSNAVTSFNTRTGAITLTSSDITNAGGALLASPALTGTPTAPTPSSTDSSTKIATTAFVQAQKYYDVVGGAVGSITSSQLMVQFVSGRTVTFPAGLTNSQGYAATAPTASATFTIVANGISVGTMVFAAGSHTATFTASSSFSVSAGQLITVTAPTTADSTLATVSFVLLGIAS